MKSLLCLIIFHTGVFGEKPLVEIENGTEKETELGSHKTDYEAGDF